jgi:predicted transcriptional regulator
MGYLMASHGGGTETANDNNVDILGLSAEIVAAYVGQNTVSQTAIPELIRTVHQALSTLGNGGEAPQPVEKAKPAVPIGRSVQHDFIVCLEDGARS